MVQSKCAKEHSTRTWIFFFYGGQNYETFTHCIYRNRTHARHERTRPSRSPPLPRRSSHSRPKRRRRLSRTSPQLRRLPRRPPRKPPRRPQRKQLRSPRRRLPRKPLRKRLRRRPKLPAARSSVSRAVTAATAARSMSRVLPTTPSRSTSTGPAAPGSTASGR